MWRADTIGYTERNRECGDGTGGVDNYCPLYFNFGFVSPAATSLKNEFGITGPRERSLYYTLSATSNPVYPADDSNP